MRAVSSWLSFPQKRKRKVWFECTGHSRNRETDWSLRQHAPQSGNAPTSRYHGRCQSRENHGNRWPGTTLGPSGSCAIWVGLARYSSQVEWKLGQLGGYRSVGSPKRSGSDTTISESGGSAFVWCKEIEDGAHPRPRQRIRVHTRGRWTHYRLVSQLRRDHARTTRRKGNADERTIIGFEREGGHPTRLTLSRLRCLHALRAENHQSPSFHRLPASAGRRKRSLVQPIFRHCFIVGGFSVWRV